MRSGILRSTPFRLILWIGSALIVGLFIHTAAAELLHVTRAQKRAERLERRSQQLSNNL